MFYYDFLLSKEGRQPLSELQWAGSDKFVAQFSGFLFFKMVHFKLVAWNWQ